jgi:uncharacterized protein (TIGR03067 family)
MASPQRKHSGLLRCGHPKAGEPMSLHLCLLCVSCLQPAPAQEDDAAKEAKALAGHWKMVKGEDKGAPLPEAIVKEFQIRIDGNNFNFTIRERAMAATFTVNPAKNPKELDITLNDGRNKGKTLKCVYELKGDIFTFRASSPDDKSERPKSLTEGGETLFVFKKEK